MQYYQGNALYNYIRAEEEESFKFCSSNIWQLVYGDNECKPKLLVVASGVTKEMYENKEMTSQETEAIELMIILGEKAGLPFRFIRFVTDISEVKEVSTIRTGGKLQVVSMQQLKELFEAEGLPVKNNGTSKSINDKTSSAYHKWQRENLGSSLSVTDFDLWKVDEEGKPIEVYELKRSFIALDKWEPYEADYNNFRLAYNTLKKAKIKFKIVYNVRTTKPWNDDISMLKVFRVNFDKDVIMKDLGYKSLEDFFE